MPENPADPLLIKILVLAPYQPSEKKVWKKSQEAKDGLHRKGTSDGASGENETQSSEEDEDEEEKHEEQQHLIIYPALKPLMAVDYN